MGKRLHDTEIWEEDWFQDLPNKYKLFFSFVKDKCDNAGIWRPNKNNFQKIVGEPVVLDEFLMMINQGKERIIILPSGKWFLRDYFVFQYGEEFKPMSPVHRGALKQLLSNGLSPSVILGISLHQTIQHLSYEEFREIAYTKDIKSLLIGFGYPTERVKDKAKDKDIYNIIEEPIENFDFEEPFIEEPSKMLENMIIQEMMQIWMKHNPKYQKAELDDFPALLKIAYRIAEAKKYAKHEVTNGKLEAVCKSWEKIVSFIKNDKFFRKLELYKIERQWTGLFQAMDAEKNPLADKAVDPTKVKIILP